MTKHRPCKAEFSSSGRSKNEFIELKDCSLSFPEFSSGIDQAKHVPRYSSIIKRTEADGVGLEDIDTLQHELEALLCACIVRKMAIKEELSVLNNIDKGKTSKLRTNREGGISPGKRASAIALSPPNKTKKLRSGKPSSMVPVLPTSSQSSKVVVGLPKVKADPSSPIFDPLQNEQIRALPDSIRQNTPKNETPSRFWSYVETYCAQVTHEDIAFLENYIASNSDLTEYTKVAQLGEHYSIRWKREDGECVAINVENRDLVAEEKPCVELMQRLVSGLIEEDVKVSVRDTSVPIADTDGDLLTPEGTTTLEGHLREELAAQGILSGYGEEVKPNWLPPENDEIQRELRRCQKQLRALSNHNMQQSRRILKCAKEELERQKLTEKLAQIDKEVIEAYKKISLARSKKKTPSKKERDLSWRVLKEREQILKQLEAID